MARSSTEGRVRRAASGVACAMLLLAAGRGAQAEAAEPPDRHVTLSATLGVSRPSESIFRDVYGDTLTPLVAQATVPLTVLGAELFAGVRDVRKAGQAVGTAGAGVSADETLNFRMTSARLGVMRGLARGAWTLGAGIGASYNWYREKWPAFGLDTAGARPGVVVQLSVARRVSRRWSVLVRGEYSRISSARARDDLEQVGLGGIDVGAGVGFRF